MIYKSSEMQEKDGRQHYPIEGKLKRIQHFVCRVTTKSTPFGPHKHDGEELWYIVEGEGKVTLDGEETVVGAGDLIVLTPWRNHGISSDSRVRWLCIG